MINKLNKQAKDMWVMGELVAIDEQTIGFQGASGLNKVRISYKREGDGFQCDAVCDRGYTYAFWFCHGNAPEFDKLFKHHDLAPLATRVVWLCQQMQNKWSRVVMDNLFNSQKPTPHYIRQRCWRTASFEPMVVASLPPSFSGR